MQNQPAAHGLPGSGQHTETGQVLPFRRPGKLPPKPFNVVDTTPPAGSIDDGFARYEESRDTPVNERKRMLMNLIAVGIVIVLIGIGVWIADAILVSVQKEDCVLQGRTNCEPIEMPAQR